MPEVARDGFVALAAFANDGGFDGLRDAVRGFVEKHFERGAALIARVGAGDGNVERIERGVAAGPVGVSGHVHADFVAGPLRLVNVGEALREADAALADERSYAANPAAVGAIMFLPLVGAVDGSGSFEDFGELGIEAGVAELLLIAGEIGAVFEIAELAFEQDQIAGEEQVFAGEVGRVVGDRVFPCAAFEIGESAGLVGERALRRRARLGVFIALRWKRRALAGFLIERVMKIEPEAAVKFKNRELTVAGIDLRIGRSPGCQDDQGSE